MEALQHRLAVLSQQIEWRQQMRVGLEMMARAHHDRDGREGRLAHRLAESIAHKREQVRSVREAMMRFGRHDHGNGQRRP